MVIDDAEGEHTYRCLLGDLTNPCESHTDADHEVPEHRSEQRSMYETHIRRRMWRPAMCFLWCTSHLYDLMHDVKHQSEMHPAMQSAILHDVKRQSVLHPAMQSICGCMM